MNAHSYLASALRRDIDRHRAGQYGILGAEFSEVEVHTLPFRDDASRTFHLAFRFWDSWIDASNHEWQYYGEIQRDDWPRLASEVVAALESGQEVRDPVLLEHFGARPGLLRRMLSRVLGRSV